MGQQQAFIPPDNFGLPAPPVATMPFEFICAGCDTIEHSPDPVVPENWSRIAVDGRDRILCKACAVAADQRRHAAHRETIERAGLGPIMVIDENGWGWIYSPEENESVGWFVNARLQLTSFPSPQTGSVVLLMESTTVSAEPPDGVMVNLDRHQLGVLIADLQAIERELPR